VVAEADVPAATEAAIAVLAAIEADVLVVSADAKSNFSVYNVG
jgi:hypothetical protein